MQTELLARVRSPSSSRSRAAAALLSALTARSRPSGARLSAARAPGRGGRRDRSWRRRARRHAARPRTPLQRFCRSRRRRWARLRRRLAAPATTARCRRSSTRCRIVLPVVLAAWPLIVLRSDRALLVAVLAAIVGYLLPGFVARAQDRGTPEADSQRPARRARSADRLHRGRHAASTRRSQGDRGARRRYPALAELRTDHHRDSRRQAAHRGVQELRRSHQGRRRAVAGGDADADRPVRHQHRPGAAHARRHARGPSGGSAPRRGPPSSASSWCSRSCSVLFPALYVVTLGPAIAAASSACSGAGL